jgi:hypothetical protein
MTSMYKHTLWIFGDLCTIYLSLKASQKTVIQNFSPELIQSIPGLRATLKLNPKKCKELRVCFLRETPDLSPLLIDGHVLEVVRFHKLLGLVIQNDLELNNHIESLVSKAYKRLYIIRTLRRGVFPRRTY